MQPDATSNVPATRRRMEPATVREPRLPTVSELGRIVREEALRRAAATVHAAHADAQGAPTKGVRS